MQFPNVFLSLASVDPTEDYIGRGRMSKTLVTLISMECAAMGYKCFTLMELIEHYDDKPNTSKRTLPQIEVTCLEIQSQFCTIRIAKLFEQELYLSANFCDIQKTPTFLFKHP